MINKEALLRFDILMANLKPVEPSSGFDFEFRQRLNAYIAESQKEAPLESIIRSIREVLDGLRITLLPQRQVLARALSAFAVVILSGYYFYCAAPYGPVIIAAEGAVTTKGARDSTWKGITLARRLKVGDIVTVGKGSQIDIELRDRYAVRIKDSARMRVAKLAPRLGRGEARFDLIEGKMLVNISDGFKGSNFIVDTKAGEAKALGTKFSIDADKSETKVSVLEGKVEVNGNFTPDKALQAKNMVIVMSGQKTEILIGEVPNTPQRLIEREWLDLEELYQIGKKPQVILMLKNTPDRVIQLLRPCPIYISDTKPREIPKLLEAAILKTADGVKTGDTAKHLESIKLLERLVSEHPNPKYDVQFLLYIGSYYEYLSYHKEAIKTFEKVAKKYPGSPLASLAQCAIGIIYEEKLHDMAKANGAFRTVLSYYPYSLEAIWVEEKLGIKKV